MCTSLGNPLVLYDNRFFSSSSGPILKMVPRRIQPSCYSFMVKREKDSYSQIKLLVLVWHLRIRVSLYSLQIAGLILTGVGGLERLGFHANWDFSIGYWMECPRWDYYKEAGSESVVLAEESTGGLCVI